MKTNVRKYKVLSLVMVVAFCSFLGMAFVWHSSKYIIGHGITTNYEVMPEFYWFSLNGMSLIIFALIILIYLTLTSQKEIK